MIKYPKGISKSSVLSNIQRDRIFPYRRVLTLATLLPAAGDIIALMPRQDSPNGARMQIVRLDVSTDSAVAKNDTDLVVFGQLTETVIMGLKDANANANEWDNLENDVATGTTPGHKLKFRVFDEAVQVGLRYTTALAAAIAAGKQVRINAEYVMQEATAATETRSVKA